MRSLPVLLLALVGVVCADHARMGGGLVNRRMRVQPVQIDLKKLDGKWYNVASSQKLHNLFFKDCQCPAINYHTIENGLHAFATCTNATSGTVHSIDATLTQVAPTVNAGAFKTEFNKINLPNADKIDWSQFARTRNVDASSGLELLPPVPLVHDPNVMIAAVDHDDDNDDNDNDDDDDNDDNDDNDDDDKTKQRCMIRGCRLTPENIDGVMKLRRRCFARKCSPQLMQRLQSRMLAPFHNIGAPGPWAQFGHDMAARGAMMPFTPFRSFPFRRRHDDASSRVDISKLKDANTFILKYDNERMLIGSSDYGAVWVVSREPKALTDDELRIYRAYALRNGYFLAKDLQHVSNLDKCEKKTDDAKKTDEAAKPKEVPEVKKEEKKEGQN